MNDLREIRFKDVKSDTTSDTQGHASSCSFSRVESTKEQGQGAKVRVQSYLVRSSEKTTQRNEQVVATNRAIVREKSKEVWSI